MKLNFQHRLVVGFLVVFALFTAAIVVFEQGSARRYKTEALAEKLDAYAGEIETYLLRHQLAGASPSLDSLLALMPAELRLTLVDRNGAVVYDNVLSAVSMDDHAGRPEIKTAREHGSGTSIRTSESTGGQYLYYAKDNGTDAPVVRVALPYDIEVQSFLKPGNAFLYFMIALFVVGLLFIFYVSHYLGRSVKRLREHEAKEKTRRLKQEMTGNIAHELRTPVTSIRGFLEIVLTGDPGREKTREYLQRAYSQTCTLSELIADMSLLARIDERQGAFEFTGIDVSALLDKVRSDVSTPLDKKHIAFTTDIPEGLTVKGNESLLYSVFRNLTDNVIAHAGEGIAIRVAVTEVTGGKAHFSFSDTGRGIPDEKHLERLFERFYRVNEGRTRDTGGSGLGLSIVKNTIALHGGSITARNNKPHGLEFIFTLPVK